MVFMTEKHSTYSRYTGIKSVLNCIYKNEDGCVQFQIITTPQHHFIRLTEWLEIVRKLKMQHESEIVLLTVLISDIICD